MDRLRGRETMKKPAGIVLIAGLLLRAGLRILSGVPSAPGRPSSVLIHAVELALGLTSLVAAAAIWKLRSGAVKVYTAWAVVWLVGGAVSQVIVEAAPVSHILIWWVVLGAVLAAVGFYLRSELRRTVRHHEVRT